jgi:hypothetical protein
MARRNALSNHAGRIGSEWEQRCVNYMAKNGFPYAERRVKNGPKDRGDLAGVPGVMLEFKAERAYDLAGYMNEVAVEKTNAHAQVGAAVVKRRKHGVDRAYVVMEFKDFLDLIR